MKNILIITAIVTVIFTCIFLVLKKPNPSLRLPQEAEIPGIVRIGNYCTGFVIQDGLIATAAHCVDFEEKVTVHFPAGFTSMFVVVAKGVNDHRDWAIMEGNTFKTPPLALNPVPPLMGDYCLSVGYGGGSSEQAVSSCQVGSIPGVINSFLVLFSIVIPGDSGSPVFDSSTFTVIGIAVRTGAPVPLGLATPIRHLIQGLEDYKREKNKDIYRPSK